MRIWPNVTDGNLRKKDQMNDTDYMTEVADVLDIYIYVNLFQFKVVSVRLGKAHMLSIPYLSEDSTVSPLKALQCWSDL